MSQILWCFVAKVRNVAILRFFFVVIFDILWLLKRFMVLFGTVMGLYGTFSRFWPVTLFCKEFTFVANYALFGVKQFCYKPCSCKFLSFSISANQGGSNKVEKLLVSNLGFFFKGFFLAFNAYLVVFSIYIARTFKPHSNKNL